MAPTDESVDYPTPHREVCRIAISDIQPLDPQKSEGRSMFSVRIETQTAGAARALRSIVEAYAESNQRGLW